MLGLIREVLSLPTREVDLQFRDALNNSPFFQDYTQSFYKETRQRHPRFPLARKLSVGFAMKSLEDDFDAYFMSIEGSARRNWKKADRNGFTARRFDFNEHLDAVREILASTEVRQGKQMPERLLKGQIKENTNPPSTDPAHDYPFYGVFDEQGALRAYAGCFVCGEICMIETIYGHAEFQNAGVVPMLVIEIARALIEERKGVKFYAYGTYYGAGESMQRFKRKLGFNPVRVRWKLG